MLKRRDDCTHVYNSLRLGDTVFLREPCVFRPYDEDFFRIGDMSERFMPVNLVHSIGVDIRFEPGEIRGRPLPEFCKLYVEPMSMAMAEKVIHLIRAHGGAEHIVTGDLPVEITGVPKAALVLGEAENLSLRAVHLPAKPNPEDHRYYDIVRLDMLFGLGNAS